MRRSIKAEFSLPDLNLVNPVPVIGESERGRQGEGEKEKRGRGRKRLIEMVKFARH